EERANRSLPEKDPRPEVLGDRAERPAEIMHGVEVDDFRTVRRQKISKEPLHRGISPVLVNLGGGIRGRHDRDVETLLLESFEIEHRSAGIGSRREHANAMAEPGEVDGESAYPLWNTRAVLPRVARGHVRDTHRRRLGTTARVVGNRISSGRT